LKLVIENELDAIRDKWLRRFEIKAELSKESLRLETLANEEQRHILKY